MSQANSKLSRDQARLFADTFNLQNLREEGCGWVADDVYTLEKDGVEGTEPYLISGSNYESAIAENDINPVAAAWAEVFGYDHWNS